MPNIGFFITFFLIFFFILFFCIYRCREYATARNHIPNNDGFYMNYGFYLPNDQSAFMDALRLKNAGDLLEYSFDRSNLIITFHDRANFHDGVKIDYQLSFWTFKKTTYMRAKRLTKFPRNNNIEYFFNEFLIKKTGVTPAEYRLFEELEKQAHHSK